MSTVSCPACQTAYPFLPQLAGKKTRCASCKQVFAFPSAAPVALVLPTPIVVPAASALQPLRMAAADDLPALQPLAPTQQASTSLWDDVPALLPSEGRPMASSFSASATPIYRGETRGATLPCGHVPPQFGEVVVQAYYRTPAWKAVLAVIIFPILAVGTYLLRQAMPQSKNLHGGPSMIDMFYEWMPSILVFITVFIAVTSIFDHLYPRVIAVTRLGIYLPASTYWWGMRFVPFSAGTRWGVELKRTPGGSYHILTIYSDVGKYYVNKAMFSSNDEYEQFTHTLHQIYPGRL